MDLAESYNEFLVGLTSHFVPLVCSDENNPLEVPHHLLVDKGEVYSALRRIKTAKSAGPDGIPNKLLKIFAFELAPVISDIYNSSLRQGIFPQILKRSHVVPTPKASPPKSMEQDLRPLSLTAQIGKLMERFVLKSLLSEVADLDKGNSSAWLLFADFRKGFDLVDDSAIITELGNLGVQPVIIRWIRSSLADREQCIKIDSCKSSWKKVNGGLPQRTKLGPLLFAILINSLLMHWQGRIKFVDDTSVLEVIRRFSPSLLPIAVRDIAEFAASRGTELNSKKCKEMLVSLFKYDLTRANSIYISGLPVERVSSYKLLGVIKSEDLTWNVYVDYSIYLRRPIIASMPYDNLRKLV